MNEDKTVSGDEARDALDSIASMERAGYRRAVPQRWFGAAWALLIGCMFALYALQDPYKFVVLPILGMAVLSAVTRAKSGAYGRVFPSSKSNRWLHVLFVSIAILVFFGSIAVRRAYDAAWVPLLVGLVVGLLVFWISEQERRAYLAKAGGGEAG